MRDLERMVEELRGQAGSTFRPAGSIGSRLSDRELEDALRELREARSEREERKLGELAS